MLRNTSNNLFLNPATNPAKDLNHPRRCAFVRRDGRKCNKISLKCAPADCLRCKTHASWKLIRIHKAAQQGVIVNADERMLTDARPRDQRRVRFYNKLGTNLESFVNQCLETPEQEQLQLFEELAIVKAFANEALQLHAAACALPETNQDQKQKKHAHIANATALCMNALDQVRIFAKAATENFAARKDVYTVHSLHDIVMQLKRFASAAFEHDPNALEVFSSMIANQLHLPKIGVEGTDLTPESIDADVIAMQDTVPLVVESTVDESEESE